MSSVVPGAHDKHRQRKQREERKQNSWQKVSLERGKRTETGKDATPIVATHASLFISEVHRSVILHMIPNMIPHFALSD